MDNGILVDEFLTTSDPRISAAGDVANAWHPLLGTRLRVEHWDNAIKQGQVAAATMLGTPTAFTGVAVLLLRPVRVRHGVPGSRHHLGPGGVPRGPGIPGVAFWLHQGTVLAAMNANIWDQGDALDTLLRSGATPSPEHLADPTVDLADLVPGSRT